MADKRAWCCAGKMVSMAALFLSGAFGFLAVYWVWGHPPQMVIVGAKLNNFKYEYVQLPDPDGTGTGTGRSLHLQQMKASLHVQVANRRTPSDAVVRDLELRLAIADQPVSSIRDAGPFHVPGRGVLPVRTYVLTATDIELGEAGIRAMDVYHVMPFFLSGQARIHRRVAWFYRDKQTTWLACKLSFNVPSAEALPFSCSSDTDYPF